MCGGENSLILLHAIFRHGERTPDVFYMYPNDPHVKENFVPYGPSNLTNVGKLTMYELGIELRNLYNDFLGDQYMPEYVDSYSTNRPRTQCSLQLTLSSLFPPKNELVWNAHLNWQPISYNCVPFENDEILGAVVSSREYLKAYYKNFIEGDGKVLFEEHREFLDYLREHSGSELKTTRDLWLFLGTLITEQENGLELPAWAAPILEQLYPIAMNEYWMQTATKELRRYAVGKLMKKILSDSIRKINGDSKCKIHLYSAHDFNVAHVLIFFEVMFPHFPRYAACVVIEVHTIDNENHRIKVKYRKNKIDNLQYLTFQNGSDYLALDEFKNMVDDLFDSCESEQVEVLSQNKL